MGHDARISHRQFTQGLQTYLLDATQDQAGLKMVGLAPAFPRYIKKLPSLNLFTSYVGVKVMLGNDLNNCMNKLIAVAFTGLFVLPGGNCPPYDQIRPPPFVRLRVGACSSLPT